MGIQNNFLSYYFCVFARASATIVFLEYFLLRLTHLNKPHLIENNKSTIGRRKEEKQIVLLISLLILITILSHKYTTNDNIRLGTINEKVLGRKKLSIRIIAMVATIIDRSKPEKTISSFETITLRAKEKRIIKKIRRIREIKIISLDSKIFQIAISLLKNEKTKNIDRFR